ncbi:MAG: protein kinase [Sandaracinaceae bacterium]
MTDSPTRWSDRYRAVAPLGEGGMGVVYRAEDEKLGRQVAVKTLQAARLGDARARSRLLREARAAAALEHPNIAQVFDVGETDDGGAFLVMEWVRGRSLRALKEEGMELPALLDVLEQIAAALDHAHGQGVVHRDVKPDNVMVRPDGRVALLDFGLAKEFGPAVADTVKPDAPVDSITREGALVGTLAYLSPEQARGADVGPWTDQFALAVTAYEIITGDIPFRGDAMVDVLAKIMLDEAVAPSLQAKGVPASMDAVFARALAKDRHERFDSVGAFVAALRACQRSQEETSLADTLSAERPRPNALESTPPSAPKESPLWRVFGLTALALFGMGMAASLLWGPPPAPEAPVPEAVACPVLEARGVSAPAGWLGAMGADLVCRGLTLRMGGDPTRTRGPAELLGLPTVAEDDFPEDPYAATDAREATLEAARSVGTYVDGRVERRADGAMAVSLTLYQNGEPRGEGTGESDALYEAVGLALDGVLQDTPYPARIDPELAPWIGTESVAVARAFDELGDATLTGVGVEARCETLMSAGDEAAMFGSEVRRVCGRWGIEGASDIPIAPLDRSHPGTLALTAPAHGPELDDATLRELAETLAEARRSHESPVARATLARGAVALYEVLDDSERASDLLLAAAADLPTDWFLRVHRVRSTLHTPGEHASVRALAAWHPSKPEAWRTLALPQLREPAAVTWLERAYLSGGRLPLYGIYLAHAELRLGRDDAVRSIAARYATGPTDTQLAGDYLRARLDIEIGRFGAAFERLARALSTLPSFGRLVDGDVEALSWLLRLAEVLGRQNEAADPLVERFVLADDHRLLVDQPHYEIPAIHLCAHASPALATPCLERLSELRAGRAARAGRMDGAAQLLEGTRYALSDQPERAALAWRPLVRTRIGSALDPRVFEAAGEPELADRIVRARLRLDTFGGASPVHAMEAMRARERGDFEAARSLARRVIDAWGASDVPIEMVATMRELLESLPDAAENDE